MTTLTLKIKLSKYNKCSTQQQFGAMAGFGAFLDSLFSNQSFVYICKVQS
jgi:hypothetical protein